MIAETMANNAFQPAAVVLRARPAAERGRQGRP